MSNTTNDARDPWHWVDRTLYHIKRYPGAVVEVERSGDPDLDKLIGQRATVVDIEFVNMNPPGEHPPRVWPVLLIELPNGDRTTINDLEVTVITWADGNEPPTK